MSQALALTPGEPAGIGPDLVVSCAQQTHARPIVAIADPELLIQRAEQLDLKFNAIPYAGQTEPAPAGSLYVHEIKLRDQVTTGELNPNNSAYVLDTLRHAAEGCVDSTYAGMITAPVHKGIINQAGIAFSGHTEFLADISGGHPVMMLACPGLRVALATTHLALKDVPAAITPDVLTLVITALDKDLRERFGIAQPNILVCGLNPHAGEDGYLGREEIEVIEPTLAELRAHGIQLSKPLPADTLFTPRHLVEADAVLAMYHDQGLPVLKHMSFGHAVNITLGLPIVRTSVDHGTALDLAGTGKADMGSLMAAIEQAVLMTSDHASND
jgi:4-hydroxythreonine-4-phosphate dehydrogenase